MKVKAASRGAGGVGAQATGVVNVAGGGGAGQRHAGRAARRGRLCNRGKVGAGGAGMGRGDARQLDAAGIAPAVKQSRSGVAEDSGTFGMREWR